MAGKEVFDRVVGKVVKLEGGHSLNPADNGNWTGGKRGMGELKGTKYGISAASYPGLDIKNLTKEQAVRIYYNDFWLANGCGGMDPALAFLHFDSVVQHGPYNADRFLSAAQGDEWVYFSKRLEFYAGLKQFYEEDGDPTNDFGRGWTRRMAAVAHEMTALIVDDSWKFVVEHNGPNGKVVQAFDMNLDLLLRIAIDRRRIYASVKEGGFDA